MKFTDIVKPRGLAGPIRKAERIDNHSEGPTADYQINATPLAASSKDSENNHSYGRPFPVRDQKTLDPANYWSAPADKDFNRFQDRLKMGKVKLCDGCGGVMGKSSRMILSPISGFVLVAFGVLLMTLYGFATNFYQPPWFLKFALPASYYLGSIFIGVGTLFFFIREKVWTCPRCKEIRKR